MTYISYSGVKHRKKFRSLYDFLAVATHSGRIKKKSHRKKEIQKIKRENIILYLLHVLYPVNILVYNNNINENIIYEN